MRRTLIAAFTGLALLFSFAIGYLTHRNEWIPLEARDWLRNVTGTAHAPAPRPALSAQWSMARDAPPATGRVAPEDAAALDALGYAGGVNPAPAVSDVTVFDAEAAWDGLNFYVSGHDSEATLMDMRGRVLHTWHYDFRDFWPDYSPPKVLPPVGESHWRRARLLPNGDVIAIFDGIAMIKLDKDSNLLWANKGGFHHDIQILPDGRIATLSRKVHVIPRWNSREPIAEDFFVYLSADGLVQEKISLLECFEHSDYASLLDFMPHGGDVFHTNTVRVLDGRHADRAPFLKAGNVLVSVWRLNTIAIIDVEKRRVVWALTGLWSKQHQPVPLENGNLLVFDNQSLGGASRVVEIDPLTQQITWTYQGTEKAPFYSEFCSAAQRLPNGNTLITETNNGRAFEVTSEGRVVWEFYNPHRSGERNELIANLFEVTRLPKDYISLGF